MLSLTDVQAQLITGVVGAGAAILGGYLAARFSAKHSAQMALRLRALERQDNIINEMALALQKCRTPLEEFLEGLQKGQNNSTAWTNTKVGFRAFRTRWAEEFTPWIGEPFASELAEVLNRMDALTNFMGEQHSPPEIVPVVKPLADLALDLANRLFELARRHLQPIE